jgi:hypothetical protein
MPYLPAPKCETLPIRAFFASRYFLFGSHMHSEIERAFFRMFLKGPLSLFSLQSRQGPIHSSGTLAFPESDAKTHASVYLPPGAFL